ncbi:MAG: TetR/AcrR family transcriptional regulator [Thalassolituus oleivorans]|nr:TetR/AcrR family transcriptional regulator [Thalassolituus oleivorans]
MVDQKEGASRKESRQVSTRSAGRPRIGGSELASKRAIVLSAVGKLLAERHSSDITVQHLIQTVGTSRPTFYRWFPGGVEQAVEMLIIQANDELVTRIFGVLVNATSIEERIKMAIRAYFDWCVDQGPVAYGIYREGFDESSPAWRYRRKTIDTVVQLMTAQAKTMGLTDVTTLSIETMVSWIESAGMVLCRHYPVNKEDADAQNTLTTDMFLATFASLK